MTDRLTSLLTDLDRIAAADTQERADCVRRASWLRSATAEEIAELLETLLARDPPREGNREALLAEAFRHLLDRQRGVVEGCAPVALTDAVLEKAAALYRHWGGDVAACPSLLCLLTMARSRLTLAEFAELMASDPPSDSTVVAMAFGPLFQSRDYDPSSLFPRLLDGICHVSVAPLILDLANFVTRERMIDRHPGAGRVSELATLLAGLVGRLGKLESTPPQSDAQWQAAGRQVNEAVSLAVSLCDALALIGDKSMVGKLYQAMELDHRRLRAEAAAALARLGEKAGSEALVQLAAEPVVRLRVLAYAEELGVLDQIDAEYRSEPAKAEAELALWLAQPSQMGMPPARLELVDSRRQYWPGFDRPVDCYLFRFVYQVGEAEFSNIGIAGPIPHAFAADLSDLPPDDIYAAFAGWHAMHEEIFEADAEELNEHQRIDVARLQRRLRDEGYEAIQPRTWGSFFGDRVLVATAVREGVTGVALADNVGSYWWPRTARRRPLGPQEAYCIYKGRKLLRAFNP